MSIDELINEYQKIIDSGYNPNIIFVEVDSEGYIVQQRGPELPYRLKPEDIEFKHS